MKREKEYLEVHEEYLTESGYAALYGDACCVECVIAERHCPLRNTAGIACCQRLSTVNSVGDFHVALALAAPRHVRQFGPTSSSVESVSSLAMRLLCTIILDS